MTGSLRSVLLKLGVFAAITLSLTGLLAAVIGNIQPFTRFYDVKAEFTDATGLLNTDVVKVAGVTVGKVSGSEIVIDPDTGKAKAIVTMRVRKDVDVPRSAHASIRFRNLLGQRMIVITRDDRHPGGPLLSKTGTAVIPLSRTSPAFDLGIVFNNLRPVLASLDPDDVNTVSRALVQVFAGRERRVQQMVSDLADVTQAIGDRGPVISELVSGLATVASDVAAHDSELRATIDSLEKVLSALANRSGELAGAVDNLGVASEGTARILENNRPGLDRAISQLRSILDTLAQRKDDLDAALAHLPAATDALNRATTYGTWENLNGVCLNGTCGPGFSSKTSAALPIFLLQAAAS